MDLLRVALASSYCSLGSLGRSCTCSSSHDVATDFTEIPRGITWTTAMGLSAGERRRSGAPRGGGGPLRPPQPLRRRWLCSMAGYARVRWPEASGAWPTSSIIRPPPRPISAQRSRSMSASKPRTGRPGPSSTTPIFFETSEGPTEAKGLVDQAPGDSQEVRLRRSGESSDGILSAVGAFRPTEGRVLIIAIVGRVAFRPVGDSPMTLRLATLDNASSPDSLALRLPARCRLTTTSRAQ